MYHQNINKYNKRITRALEIKNIKLEILSVFSMLYYVFVIYF
jgi:hypothetical protein